jgi:CRP-like cAMP-binding protein
MYFQQKHLLSGMDRGFVKRLMEMTEKKSFAGNDYVFHAGHHASRFYVLMKGAVKLSFGTSGQMVFTLNHAGEAFGWSSLLGRSLYAANAQCTEPTRLIRIDRVKFNTVLEADPVNGLVLVRRLSEMLGERLNRTYKMLADRGPAEFAATFGTGQIMEMLPPV